MCWLFPSLGNAFLGFSVKPTSAKAALHTQLRLSFAGKAMSPKNWRNSSKSYQASTLLFHICFGTRFPPPDESLFWEGCRGEGDTAEGTSLVLHQGGREAFPWQSVGHVWQILGLDVEFFYRPRLPCLSHSHPCEVLPPRGTLGRQRGVAGARVSPEDPAGPVCTGLCSGCGPKLWQSSSCPGPHSSRRLFPLHFRIFATSGLNFPKRSEVLRAFSGARLEGVLS